jgi:hypothetical protein
MKFEKVYPINVLLEDLEARLPADEIEQKTAYALTHVPHASPSSLASGFTSSGLIFPILTQ